MSLRILHTADWHLGKRLDHFSRLEEQRQVLEEICVIADAQQVDAVIVAGDLFDVFNPPVEAVELLYKTLKRLTAQGKRPVIAIAGNHDSPDRIDAPDALALECGIVFVGYPQAVLRPISIDGGFRITKTDCGFLEILCPNSSIPLRVITTPYANELRLKTYLGATDKEVQMNQLLHESWTQLADEYCDDQGVNILTTHLYMLKRGGELLEEPDGEKPLKVGNADLIYSDSIPPQIQYTALGHLHRYQNIGGHQNPVVYSSSPLCYSFAEAGQQKQVVLIEAEPGKAVAYRPIGLTAGRPLYRKKFDDIDAAVTWLLAHPYTLVELTISSDTFLATKDLKRLYDSHDGIIHLIPVVNKQQENQESKITINLEQNRAGLFVDYFMSKHKQAPNEELLNLFREITGQQNEL
ncbi:metallophosphoesterase family protein [Flavobacterium sp. JP2137]|uniref:metallophosphoesterase family protein n=1 Tax=Flavobacterium sp. JP2137 TaxID=3414510 RepID=UPI003D2FC322